MLEQDVAIENPKKNLALALVGAARHRHTEVLKSLLEYASINDCVLPSVTAQALNHAADNGHTEIVKALLECGVDTEYTGKFPMPALYYVAQSGHTETFKVLLEYNAKTDRLIECKRLMSNIVSCNYIKMTLLVYQTAFKCSPAQYCSLLHRALFYGVINPDWGRYEMFMTMFNKEALTYTGQYASFPLHLKAIAESPERYLELMQFGIERDKAGDAAEEGYIFESRQKLDRWRDQAMESMDDFFLDSAWMLDFLTLDDGECIREWLLKYESKLETARWKGLSLLHLVVLQNRPDVLALLLFILKDLSPMSLQGLTPLHCARMLGYEGIRDILEPAVLQSEGKPTSCRKYRGVYYASPPPVFSLQSLAANVVRRSGESLSSMHRRLKGAPGLTQMVFAQAPPKGSSGEKN